MTIPAPVPPEDLQPGQLSLIPDVPTERTATALLALLGGVAEQQDVPEGQLVQLVGAILEHGSAGIFGRLPYEGAAEFQAHIVGWFREGKGGGFTSITFSSQDEAMEHYEAAMQRLSGPPQ